MCPRGLSGGGESQNGAKSRRFGMNMPCRAFYEGVNPKTIWNNNYSGHSMALPDPVLPLPFPVSPLPVFLTCNVGKKIGLPRTFSSGRVTSGNCQCAFQALLGHFLFFLIYHIRSRIGLPRTFSSRCVTSGEEKTASVIKEWLLEVEALCFGEV